jgi:hypothetical protein
MHASPFPRRSEQTRDAHCGTAHAGATGFTSTRRPRQSSALTAIPPAASAPINGASAQ